MFTPIKLPTPRFPLKEIAVSFHENSNGPTEAPSIVKDALNLSTLLFTKRPVYISRLLPPSPVVLITPPSGPNSAYMFPPPLKWSLETVASTDTPSSAKTNTLLKVNFIERLMISMDAFTKLNSITPPIPAFTVTVTVEILEKSTPS